MGKDINRFGVMELWNYNNESVIDYSISPLSGYLFIQLSEQVSIQRKIIASVLQLAGSVYFRLL